MDNIKHGVPQGSILGPLLFLVYINDLPFTIRNLSQSVLFADDTSVIVKSKDFEGLESRLNTVLNCMCEWFEANKLSLNLEKSNVIKFQSYKSADNKLCISNNGRFLEQTVNTKFLDLQIDKYLNWKEHIEYITPKLASALYAIRSMSTYVCTGTLKLIYHAYFHSLMKYGIIFWGNSINSKHIFILQKKGIRIMARAGKRDSCRNLF